VRRPEKPERIAYGCQPFARAVLTTARIAAFIPAASPPLVSTPMRFFDIAQVFPTNAQAPPVRRRSRLNCHYLLGQFFNAREDLESTKADHCMEMFLRVSCPERTLEDHCFVHRSAADLAGGSSRRTGCVQPADEIAEQERRIVVCCSSGLLLLVMRLQQPHVFFTIKNNSGQKIRSGLIIQLVCCCDAGS